MSYLQAVSALANSGGSGGHGSSISPVDVSTPIQVNSFGVNLGSFIPSLSGGNDGAIPYQTRQPLFTAPGTNNGSAQPLQAGLANIDPMIIVIALAAFLLLKRKGR